MGAIAAPTSTRPRRSAIRVRIEITMNRRTLSYTLFDTPIGRCGVAWSERGIARIQLPEASDAKAVHRLAMNDDLRLAEPPPAIARYRRQYTTPPDLGSVEDDAAVRGKTG